MRPGTLSHIRARGAGPALALVFAMAIAALAAAPQSRAQWVPDGVVVGSNPDAGAFWPNITADTQGGAYIVWRHSTDTDRRIVANHIDGSGALTWDPTGLPLSVELALGADHFPAIVPDGSGGAIVAWDGDSGSGEDDIFMQRMDDSGELWAPGGLTLCNAASPQWYPTLVPDGSGGALAFWADFRRTAWPVILTDMYAERIDSDGNLLWEPVLGGIEIVHDSSAGSPVPRPIPVVSDDAGGAIVALTRTSDDENWDLYAKRVGPNGLFPWGEVAVCSEPGYRDRLKPVVDGAGGVILVWDDCRESVTPGHEDRDIYAQRLDADGNIVWQSAGVPVLDDEEDTGCAGAVSDAAGGAIVFWATAVGKLAQRIDPAGNLLWPAGGIEVSGALDRWFVTCIADGSGGAIIVLGGPDDATSSQDLYVQRINSAGELYWPAGPQSICTAPGQQENPGVVLTDTGNAIVAWSDFRNMYSNIVEVYAQGIDFSVPPDVPEMTPEPEFTQGVSNTVSWSDEAGSGADSYRVQCAEDDQFTVGLQDSDWLATLEHTFGGLTGGQSYFYRVKAQSAADSESDWSPSVASTQDDGPPVSNVDPLDAEYAAAEIPVPFSGSDAVSGLASVELLFRCNGGGYTSYGSFTVSPILFAPSLQGIYDFYTLGTDVVGNQEAPPVAPDASTVVSLEIWSDATAGPLGDTGSGMGVAWGDYDDDGDQDLYVSNSGQANRLLNNDGGTFTDVTTAPLDFAGLSRGVAWGDYDNDGDLDLYLANKDDPNVLFRNDTMGSFTALITGPLGFMGDTAGVAWGDFDLDGDLDIFLANCGTYDGILINNGGDNFSYELVDSVIRCARAVACADYDNDGDLDVYVVNAGANVLWRNDGDGNFSDESAALPAAEDDSRGGAWADYDNDGHLDLYVANNGQDRLYRNLGNATFAETTSAPLGDVALGSGIAWGDYDHDGDQDLYLARNFLPNILYRNEGGGLFVDATRDSLADEDRGRGVAWCDYDNDGDLDLYLTNYGQANKLIRNDQALGNHWLQLDLTGELGNLSAIGARVEVIQGENTQIQEVSGGSGWLSQNALPLTFGTGAATVVDELIVRWPYRDTHGAFHTTHLYGVDVDTVLVFLEQVTDVKPGRGLSASALSMVCYPNPFNPTITISYTLPSAMPVWLQLYDVRGRLLRTLRDGDVEDAGVQRIRWSGRDDAGRSMGSGVYYARVRTGIGTETRLLTLVK